MARPKKTAAKKENEEVVTSSQEADSLEKLADAVENLPEIPETVVEEAEESTDDFVYNPNGTVNWRAMVDSKYLYPNRSWFERYNKPVPESIDGLCDNQLLIKQYGLMELAWKRGFTSIEYPTEYVDRDFAACRCRITWVEFKDRRQTYPVQTVEGCANIHAEHRDPPFCYSHYALCENAARNRAIRFFLGIDIVSEDEIVKEKTYNDGDGGQTTITGGQNRREMPTPQNVIEATSQKYLGSGNIEDLKDFMRKEWAKIKDLVSFTAADVKGWKETGAIRDAGISDKFCQELTGVIKKRIET